MLNEDLKGTNYLVVDTFDFNSHVFSLVKKDERYYLQLENDTRLIKKLVIKPDLWAFFENDTYEQGVTLLKPCHKKEDRVLAMDYNIDPNIFDCLIQSDLISYSKAMADLYNLPPAYSSDAKYHHNDYKRTKSKNTMISRLKRGEFN